MKHDGVTVLPLTQDECIVEYIIGSGGRTKYKRLYLPQEHIRFFQRNIRRGEKPMTFGEFNSLYIQLVDSDTELIK